MPQTGGAISMAHTTNTDAGDDGAADPSSVLEMEEWMRPLRELAPLRDALAGVTFWLRENDIEARAWPSSPLRYQLAQLEGRLKAFQDDTARIKVLVDIVETTEAASPELAQTRRRAWEAMRELVARAAIAYQILINATEGKPYANQDAR